MAGPIRIAILANGRQARSEAALTARAYGVMGRRVSSTAKLIGGVFAVASLVRVGKAVGEVGASYVDSLNKIQALTGSTDRQMGKLATRIESQSSQFAKYGQTTGDAASGLVELTKSGLTAQKALGAIRGTMLLAKAGELEVADASGLVANTLNTFGLKAKAASAIANSLANAANISSADVSDLAESFKYVAPLAAKAGLSVDQTNAALAELANSGLKASQAGTTMRGMLVALQAPSTAGGDWLQQLGVKVYGAGGKMRDFGSILEDLRTGLAKVSDEDANFALKSIFGKNAITGASVLIKGGIKDLDTYTKGVKRAGAADKLAASASKGLAGTLKSLKSQVTSTVQELYRRYSPALDARIQSVVQAFRDNKDEIADVARTVTSKVTPALSAISDVATGHVAPALKSIANLAKDTAAAFAGGDNSLAQSIGKTALSALSSLADLAKKTADGLDRIPGPIKAIGVQAAIAALVLPRLSAGVTSVTSSLTLNIARLQQWRAEMTYATTRAQSVSAMMQRLGGAARAAAGIGGMLLLADGAQRANKSLGFLEKTAGGALLGASFGPQGAVIGAAAGALYGLATATSQAAVETVKAKDSTQAYVDTLNELTGASTRATRARIFDRLMADKATAGLVTGATKAGVASRDIVSAVLGQRGAWTRLQASLAEVAAKYTALKNPESARGRALAAQMFALQNLAPALRAESSALASSIAATKAKADAVINWSKALHGIPPKVQAKLKNENYDPTRKQVDQLVEKYKLVPAQKRTILQAVGVAQAKTDAQKALDAFNKLPRRLQTEIREVGAGETKRRLREIANQGDGLSKRKARLVIQATGAKVAVKDILKVKESLGKLGGVRPGTQAWLKGLSSDVSKGESKVKQSAAQIKREFGGGSRQWKADLGPYNQSIRDGLDTAKKTASTGGGRVGANLKAGIFAGFAGTATALAAEAAAAVHRAVAAARAAGKIHSPSKVMHDKVGRPLGQGVITGFIHETKKGESGVKSALDKLMGVISSRLDGKKQAGRRKSLLKSLKDERTALITVGRTQDENNKNLDKAIAKYKALKQRADQFAASIKSGFQSYGSVVGLGTLGGGTAVTSDALISQLTARAQVANRFAAIIDKLRGKLNKTSLKQLLDTAASGDLEGALATAQAISSGGGSAINQINQLTSQITAVGGKLGTQMRHDFYGAGLHAADGLVEGLKARKKQIEKIAEFMAKALVDKVKHALGIHSPSRVFAQIGALTADGITVGIKARDTHVRRSGAALAASLQKGYGTPALDAYMSSASSRSASAPQTITLRLTAEQISQLQRGREIQADLDVYRGAGGRSKVRTK